MPKSRKFIEKTGAESGQFNVSRKSGSQAQPPAASKFVEVGVPKTSAKDVKMTINSAGSYKRGTTIIAEKTDRPEWQMTAVEKMDMVRRGVTKKKLESLKSKTNLD